MQFEQPTQAPAAQPRESLSPNQYAGAYLLGLYFLAARETFIPTLATQRERTKIYQRQGQFYVVPQQGQEPPDGYGWQHIFKLKGRDMYVAAKRV